MALKNKPENQIEVRKKKFDFFPYLINLPMILYLVCVMAFALGWGIVMSFTNKTIGGTPKFIGIDNYIYLLKSPEYRTSIAITLKFTALALFFKLIFGTGMALTLNQKFKGRNAVCALLLIPWSLPNIVSVLNWKWIFSNNNGIANYILKSLGIVDRDVIWTGVAGMALIVILVADVWRGSPFFGISILAKLQTISNDYYEAAKIDGAGVFTCFFKITIPFVKDTMMITKVRVLPLYSSAVLMYCRSDKLQAAGYTAPPKTWEEVFEMARAVSDPENGFFGLGIGCGPANDDDCYDLVLNYIHSNGDAMFDEKGNPTTNNDGLKKWFTMWKDLYAEEVIPTDALTWDSSGNNNTYLTGQSCFVFNAATLANALSTDESMADLYANTWIAPMPEGEAGLITSGNWHGLSIAEASQNKELAAQLLKYIFDADWLAEYSENCRPLLSPSVESLAMSDMWQADPICKAVVDCASRGTGRWGCAAQTSTGLAIGAKLVYSFKMNEMCNAVASGTLTVDEALAEYQKTAEEIAATFM